MLVLLDLNTHHNIRVSWMLTSYMLLMWSSLTGYIRLTKRWTVDRLVEPKHFKSAHCIPHYEALYLCVLRLIACHIGFPIMNPLDMIGGVFVVVTFMIHLLAMSG